MNKIIDLKLIPAMAHSIDANGYLLNVSDIWLNKLGYLEDEVIGRKSTDFLTESSKKYALEIVLPEFFKVGYCTNIEYQFVKKDGSVLDTLLSATLEKDQKGNNLRSLAVIVDITERKKAEKELLENNNKLEKLNSELNQAKTKTEISEMNLRLLLESSEDMITIHDLNGTYLNYFGPDKYSLKPIDFIGKRIENFLSKDNADLLNKQIKKTAISGQSAIVDIYDYWQGEKTWFEEKIFPLKTENKITNVAKICSIITDRKNFENELLKSQKQYKRLVDNLNGIVWEADFDTLAFSFVSKQAEVVLGYSVNEWIDNPKFWEEHLHTDDKEWAVKFFNENALKNEKFEFSYRMITSDSKIVWIKERVNITFEKDGVRKLSGMLVDITENKLKNIKLEQNQLLLEESQKIAKLGGWELDLITGELYWTAETYRIHETSPEEFNPTVDAGVSYFLPESKKTIIEALDLAMTIGKGYDLQLETYTTKGSKINVRTTCRVTMTDGKPTKLTGIFQDITKQVEAENKLRDSEEKYKTLFENNPMPLVVYNRNSLIIQDGNQASVDKYGYSKEEFIGKSILDIRPKDDIDKVANLVVKKTDKIENVGVWKHIKKNGDILDMEVFRKSIIYNGEDSILGLLNDVTDKLKAEAELRDSEEKYKTLFENNPMPLVVYNRQTLLIQDINQANVEKYGYSKEDIIGKTIFTFRPKEDIDKFTHLFLKKTEEIENAGVWKHIKKNGDILDMEVFRKSIIYNGEDSILGLLNDVTDKLKAEAELILNKKAVETSFEGIVITDPNKKDNPLIYVNKRFEQITGYSNTDVIGKNCRFLHGPETNIEELNRLRKCIREKRDYEGELLNYRKDGSTYWNYLRITTIKNKEDEVTYFVGFQNDITEKKVIQLSLIDREKTLNDIIMFSPIPIVISKISDGELILVNSSFEKLIGADKNYLIGRKSIEFYAEPNEREEIIDLIKTIGKIESKDIKLRKIDGLIIDCLMSVENIIFNNENVNLITLVDISDLKETENNLINARVEAERVSKLKSSFLANMSHELRTPMNGILGFSNFISTLDDIEDIREMSSFINVSANRLMETLNLILDISTIESGVAQIILEEMDLIEFINDNIQLFKVNADSKNLSITFDKYFDQLIINSNRQAIQSIISNLINNAIKFTTIGGISINLEIVIEEYKVGNTVKWAIIKVSDTGIGIEQEHLEVIFDEFRQVSEGHNRSFEGTGLGLSLTKKYIELLGGSIGVESKINEGTTFTVKIPINQKEWVQPKVIEIVEKVENIEEFKPNKHILVIEDDYPSLRLIELLLKGKCVVDSSSKPLDAIEKAKAKNYDLIITDINLGRGLNGLYVTRELRKLPQYKNTAIIAMTAYAMKGDKEEFLEAGCTDYISKPIDQHLLVSMVQDYLNKE